MKINEIELINSQSFPKETVADVLKTANKIGNIEHYNVFQKKEQDTIMLILSDENEIAAFATFIVRLGGKVWESKNVETFPPFNGNMLVAKLYKFVKEELKKSIQSDVQQTLAGSKIWTTSLPKLGINPKVLDTETEKVYNPDQVDIYSVEEPYRYVWIIERFDHYPIQNTLTEGLLFPLKGLWYIKREFYES